MSMQQGAGGSMGMITILQFGLIIGVVYFMLIRPGNKARKETAAMLAALKKHDDIVTAGGIVGRVKEIKDDLVTIESGTSTLVVERQRIVRVGDKAPGAA